MQHEMDFECRANPLCAYSATTIDSSLLRRRILPTTSSESSCAMPHSPRRVVSPSSFLRLARSLPISSDRSQGTWAMQAPPTHASRYHGHGSAHATPPRQPSIVITFGQSITRATPTKRCLCHD